MGLFDKLFGKKENTALEPNPAPAVPQPSKRDLIESAIASNPNSARFRAEYTEDANFQILDFWDYVTKESPLSFVSFDLETTGLDSVDDAIVEIGAVRVVNGEITEKFHQLIDPERPVSPDASSVNHITDDMLVGKPRIYEILPDFLSFVGSDVLVAHNVRFDSAFISKACLRYRFIYPKTYFDSRDLSVIWPDLPNRKLSTFLDAAGINNAEAHRALSDAESLAQLMIVSMNTEFSSPLPAGFDPGYSNDHFTGTVDIVDQKLSKKRFVLTGKIGDDDRVEFEKMILSHGGKCTQKISSATDYLVVGSFPGLPSNYVTSKVAYARKLIAEGGKIEIISPSDVLSMLEDI